MVRQEKCILFWIIPLLAVFLAVPLQLLAQGGATGAISGIVQDQKGDALAGASVTIISEATKETIRQLKTDASGLFSAPLLPAATYTVEVSAPGFAATKFAGVEVHITETTRVTAELKVAGVQQEVEVLSQATQVDTTNAATGESISNVNITALPLATRNFQQLLALSAGASANLNNAAALGRGNVSISVNGGRENNNNYLIEGISATDYSLGVLTYTPVPDPDAIQEFKVGTSLYDATQGRNGGGNINAILKSGTSSFHGSAWEYFRNSKLDAADYFIGPFDLKQNIFGGDFGGPVGAKAKLGYIYMNYQGTRQSSGDSLGTYISGAQVPVLPSNRTSQSLIADFFPSGLPSYANTGNGYGGLDPVAYKVLTAAGTQFGASTGGYLIPTVAGTPGSLAGSLTISTPGSYRDDQFTANWDRDFNRGKDHLSERTFWSDSEQHQPFGADYLQVGHGFPPVSSNMNLPLEIPLRGRFASIAETHTFSNSLVNEFRFGVNITNNSFQNVAVAGTSATDLGVINGSGAPDMPRFEFSNGLQLGSFPNQPESTLSDGLSWLDTLSWTHGPHSFRFGGEIDHIRARQSYPVLDNGVLYFFPGADNTLNYFQNFLLGEPSFALVGGGAANHDYRIPAFSAFVQDDYRVASKLTLNLGLRTEWVGAAYDNLCHLGNSIPENANLTGDPYVYPSCVSQFNTPGFSGKLNSAALNNEYATVIEPRIGFAYDLAGNQKTVIRGGYGIYSIREDLEAVDNLAFSPPFFPVSFAPGAPGSMGSILSVGTPLGQVSAPPTPSFFQGFPGEDTTGSPLFSGSVANTHPIYVPLHWIVPTTQQWNLTVQRQLGGNWVLELGYVGTKGTHLRAQYDSDQPALASPSNPITITCGNAAAGVPCLTGSAQYTITQNTIANSTARVPYLGINPSGFFAYVANSNSHYNGLQATLSHHFSKGLYLQSAYTFSKSADEQSTSHLTRLNDQNSASASRGPSDYDHHHRFATSFNYFLPSPATQGVVKDVLGNWVTSGVIVVQSGAPITILDGNGGTVYNLSTPSSTADFAPGFSCSNALNTGGMASKIANWVKPNAYLPAPVVGVDGSTGYGDSPRNCITGPGQWNVDYTLGKTFKLTEHQELRFRSEFFNLFNHPSFANPSDTNFNNVQNGGQIGELTQTVGTPRLVQFSLKYMF